MKSCYLKWIFSVFLFLKTNSAVEFSNLDLANVEILEDETVLRPKRQAVDYGSGEVICEGTPNQDCYLDEGVCFCECKDNFYSEEGQGCIRGKLFGGNITFNNEYDPDNRAVVIETVNVLFNLTEDIVEIYIDSIQSGSIKVGYILMFRNVESIDKDVVQERLETQLNCSKTNDTPINGLTLNVNSSCETVVSNITDEIVCSTDYNNCDEISTSCTTADSGFLLCNCKTNFYQINATTCLEQICAENSDCNSPFGWCTTNEGVASCTCMWGFDGLQCYQPWLFTLTVVGGGCVLIILILIIALVVCSRKKKTKKPPKPVKDDDSVHDDEPPTRFQPSSYQLGMMRARMPSVYDRSNNPSSRNIQQMSYGENGRKSGRSNNAYDDYASSTTTFNSPQRGRRYPNEYF